MAVKFLRAIRWTGRTKEIHSSYDVTIQDAYSTDMQKYWKVWEIKNSFHEYLLL